MEIVYSTKFKKDLKRYANDKNKIKSLYEVILYLKKDGSVPAKYKPHSLIGDYKDCMECHIENDFLLIWNDKTSGIIKLIRLGSHSELF